MAADVGDGSRALVAQAICDVLRGFSVGDQHRPWGWRRSWGVHDGPTEAVRLVGAVLSEQPDEWRVSNRRYLSEESMALIWVTQTDATEEANQLPAAE